MTDKIMNKPCENCGIGLGDVSVYKKLCEECKKNNRIQVCKNYNVNYKVQISIKSHNKYLQNIDAEREKSRLYRLNNPEKRRQSQNNWAENNREKQRGYSRKWKHNNHERITATSKIWREKNPDKVKAHGIKRKLLAESGDIVNPRDLKRKLEYCNYHCQACGVDVRTTQLHWDHDVPLSKGGTSTLDNLEPLCQSCNQTKHTKFRTWPLWRETYPLTSTMRTIL